MKRAILILFSLISCWSLCSCNKDYNKTIEGQWKWYRTDYLYQGDVVFTSERNYCVWTFKAGLWAWDDGIPWSYVIVNNTLTYGMRGFTIEKNNSSELVLREEYFKTYQLEWSDFEEKLTEEEIIEAFFKEGNPSPGFITYDTEIYYASRL